MSEYIEREAALSLVQPDAPEDEKAAVTIATAKKLVRSIVRRTPAADVAPVKHGRWEGYSHSRYCGVDDFGDPIYKDGVVYYCSECRRKTVIKERYCPKCGARMDGDSDAKAD